MMIVVFAKCAMMQWPTVKNVVQQYFALNVALGFYK